MGGDRQLSQFGGCHQRTNHWRMEMQRSKFKEIIKGCFKSEQKRDEFEYNDSEALPYLLDRK